MSANLKPTELSEPTQSRLRRLALMLCAIALLALTSVPIAFLNHDFFRMTCGASLWVPL
jgi:hypothetical protein